MRGWALRERGSPPTGPNPFGDLPTIFIIVVVPVVVPPQTVLHVGSGHGADGYRWDDVFLPMLGDEVLEEGNREQNGWQGYPTKARGAGYKRLDPGERNTALLGLGHYYGFSCLIGNAMSSEHAKKREEEVSPGPQNPAVLQSPFRVRAGQSPRR